MRHTCTRVITAILLSAALAQAHAGELIVSAAASLTNAFKELASAYQSAHPDTRVHLNSGASGALLQQITQGAPVDVFASADQETMDLAAERQLIDTAQRADFARNALVVVVPRATEQPPTTLEALRPLPRIAIGNPASVPAGRYAQSALEQAQLWEALHARLILAQNVRQALDYVARGEVEAGFVYRTDAQQAADRVTLAFSVNLPNAILYPIATTRSTRSAEEAQRFVAFVRSASGQAILHKYGFLTP